MKFIDIAHDPWHTVGGEDGPIPHPQPKDHLLLTLEQWHAVRETWPAGLAVGVILPNSVDVETLAALEDAIENFAGCAVVISHDRFFLDRLATHILAFEGNSHVEWFEGNFAMYEEDKRRRLGDAADRPTRLAYKKLTR